MGIFFGALLAAIGAGLIGYLIARLTVAVIKGYRRRRNTKVVAASMRAIAREALNDPRAAHIRIEDLDCDSVLMEYDPDSDEIVHSNRCAETDAVIARHMAYGNGVAIYD